MAFFKRNKTQNKNQTDEESKPGGVPDGSEASPQSVGVVSGVLSTSRDFEADSPFGDVVERRFGLGAASTDEETAPPAEALAAADELALSSARRAHLRAVDALFEDDPRAFASDSTSLDGPELEVDPMAHIGRAMTITGDIVAEEDLEIRGTVEGSVRLAEHQVTIGEEGHVKASVEAHSVVVIGRITGDVVATEKVEVMAGGVIGGDVKAPRVIMNDGAIVVGALDMSQALAGAGVPAKASPGREPEADIPEASEPERPKLMWVEPSEDATLRDDLP